MTVYQTNRAGVATYTIPGLTAGSSYPVLLHFVETYFSAKGKRAFNVAINGTTVLTNLDIYAAVGEYAALVEQFTATANSSGDIVIALTDGTANQPVISGIEIRGASAPACSAVPSAPSGLAVTGTTASSISLGWSAVTPPANCSISSYTIYGGTSPNPTTVVGSVTGTSFTNTGLAASTTYYYAVAAVDTFGSSPATPISGQTQALVCSAVPAAPSGLTANATSSTAITVSWSPVTPPANCSISSYTVYGGTDSKSNRSNRQWSDRNQLQ